MFAPALWLTSKQGFYFLLYSLLSDKDIDVVNVRATVCTVGAVAYHKSPCSITPLWDFTYSGVLAVEVNVVTPLITDMCGNIKVIE